MPTKPTKASDSTRSGKRERGGEKRTACHLKYQSAPCQAKPTRGKKGAAWVFASRQPPRFRVTLAPTLFGCSDRCAYVCVGSPVVPAASKTDRHAPHLWAISPFTEEPTPRAGSETVESVCLWPPRIRLHSTADATCVVHWGVPAALQLDSLWGIVGDSFTRSVYPSNFKNLSLPNNHRKK